MFWFFYFLHRSCYLFLKLLKLSDFFKIKEQNIKLHLIWGETYSYLFSTECTPSCHLLSFLRIKLVSLHRVVDLATVQTDGIIEVLSLQINFAMLERSLAVECYSITQKFVVVYGRCSVVTLVCYIIPNLSHILSHRQSRKLSLRYVSVLSSES